MARIAKRRPRYLTEAALANGTGADRPRSRRGRGACGGEACIVRQPELDARRTRDASLGVGPRASRSGPNARLPGAISGQLPTMTPRNP
ncbi:Eukaryotic translation initiation factor 4B [Burkholderia gladioli]|nr:Eukaryotic translation initiation factor 4B [Burkholderia gladioli]